MSAAEIAEVKAQMAKLTARLRALKGPVNMQAYLDRRQKVAQERRKTLRRLLKKRPQTSQEIAVLMGLTREQVCYLLRELRAEYLCHICGYKAPDKGALQPVYKLGAGEDATKPAGLTPAQKRDRQNRLKSERRRVYRETKLRLQAESRSTNSATQDQIDKIGQTAFETFGYLLSLIPQTGTVPQLQLERTTGYANLIVASYLKIAHEVGLVHRPAWGWYYWGKSGARTALWATGRGPLAPEPRKSSE